MGGSSKKGGGSKPIPQINPQALIDQAVKANRVGVNTPFGSQAYSTGPNGQTTLTTTLSPEMQALLTQQLGRAGGAAQQYVLPSQNADILNGLNTRINQRYGIALPPPTTTTVPPGGGGGTPPAPTPTTPPPSTPPPSPIPDQSGSGSGSGGDWEGFCVAAGSFLSGGEFAEDAQPGDLFDVHSPESGFHQGPLHARGKPVIQPCVAIATDGGAVLRCSASTPFNDVDAVADLEGSSLAPDMLGKRVFVRTPDGVEIQTVASVREIGDHFVIPLDFGGKSFPAGDTPEALVYSHNMLKGPMLNPAQMAQGMDFTMAPQVSGMNGLSGSIDQSYMGAQAYGIGPYSPQQAYENPSAAIPAGYTYDENGQLVYTGTPNYAPVNGNTAAGIPVPNAPQASQQPGYSGFMKFLSAITPGRQVPDGGAGQWIRGAAQLKTGLPIATGYDLTQRNKTP